MELQILPFLKEHIPAVKTFTDQWIGQNYFSLSDLQQVHNLSCSKQLNASFVAFKGEKLAGVRLSFAPGKWAHDYKDQITPTQWQTPVEHVAYFKSLFIREDLQGKKLGQTLSHKSIEVLKEMGAKAVVCHSWLESPNNSSQRYLLKMGFKEVYVHKRFWFNRDYACTLCGPQNKCQCTAVEMIKYL